MLKIGLLGTGYIGKVHAECWNKLDECQIYGVCDSNIKKAEDMGKIFGAKVFCELGQMLDEGIDILDVCVPTPMHLEVVKMALEKKIPVLCEKPIASNLEEAEQMLKLSRDNQTMLMIAHCVRFDPYYAYLKKAIQDNLFGDLISLKLFRNSAIPKYSEGQWLLNVEDSGGVAMDLHIHDVDIIYWLLRKPEWIFTNANSGKITTLYGYQDKNVTSEASWRKQDSYPFNAGYDVHFEQASL